MEKEKKETPLDLSEFLVPNKSSNSDNKEESFENEIVEEMTILQDKLKQKENTIAYLKQLLLLKDKKIDIQNQQIEKIEKMNEKTPHHKQIYTLVDKLQHSEEEIEQLKSSNEKLKLDNFVLAEKMSSMKN